MFWRLIRNLYLSYTVCVRPFGVLRRYLSASFANTDNENRASNGYESISTVVSMANVYVDNSGVVWNSKVRDILDSTYV